MIRLLLTPLHQRGYSYDYPGRHITGNIAVNKRTITLILVAYLTIIWAAVIFRIDQFPLTWVLMYSVY